MSIKIPLVATILSVALMGCIADTSPTIGGDGGGSPVPITAPGIEPESGPIDPDCCHDVPGGGHKCTC